MAKTFMGVRLRSLRAERGITQAALAQALGLSPSYLNQIEQDQRPLTVAVLLKIHKVLGVDIQQFSEDEEARLLAQLRDALAAMPQPTAAVPLPELREVATRLPQLAQALLAMHQRHVADVERLEALTARLGDGRSELAEGGGGASALLAEPARQMPFEAVRDFFFAHRNHFDALDRAAETLATQAREQTSAQGGSLQEWLQFRLQARHQVLVLRGSQGGVHSHRRFDAATRTLYVAPQLRPAQQAFQLATQLALLEFDALIEDALKPTHWQDEATRRLARMGLANYVAGAFVLPYGEFLQAAESLQYDVDLLARRFGVGFETVCHRLSTLQRAEAPGVPFFFIRVDRAGNISKRQSATHFHFSKTGGTCPLWVVYEAFTQPGRIVPQLASMPDGRVYLWIARTISRAGHGWGAPGKTFSIGMGCDLQHAARLVYSKGLDLRHLEAATPIGMGCKVCERNACPQRAFPFVGKPLRVNEHESGFVPYG
ncbi:short-chain fatty acyl-CoA regulator family protein [Comamonas terrigena]|uniref:short-chain fatty acyl-CoA regulator family protein n=1 Tax=Comamonas terrigena TaxID=32013 RepID=UPI00244BB334|nr:short-chain fatty acyl-CoA regulator family protein [Comamonas terrigena]MDH0050392.1 short-chain fatty acyl-CoA regulator family protein [Comamonas terrigena]MDH0512848.1 short-chain fatty acyl-CoA regulator family protein [Comamonas terrigena]MDH1092177.1 short-chain fatty acyl-CoA regulator family protein [Comamonas terrigena]MDH1501023.1 short-chain fatty acyl-CoA regulator family protein [Comamonas terrigena]